MRTPDELAAYWAIDPGVYAAGREEQREADAALVKAAGCHCRVLLAVGCFRGRLVPLEDPEPYDTEGRPKIAVHDPERCPISLAAKIRSGG